jgi:hypothetical protein
VAANIPKKQVIFLFLCLGIIPLAFFMWLFISPAKTEVPSDVITFPNIYSSKLFLSILAAACLLLFLFRAKKK